MMGMVFRFHNVSYPSLILFVCKHVPISLHILDDLPGRRQSFNYFYSSAFLQTAEDNDKSSREVCNPPYHFT